MLDLVLVTIVCWSLAAWLFWKWDLGGYRSEFPNTLKERGNTKSQIKDARIVSPIIWRYECFP